MFYCNLDSLIGGELVYNRITGSPVALAATGTPRYRRQSLGKPVRRPLEAWCHLTTGYSEAKSLGGGEKRAILHLGSAGHSTTTPMPRGESLLIEECNRLPLPGPPHG